MECYKNALGLHEIYVNVDESVRRQTQHVVVNHIRIMNDVRI